MSVKSSKIYCDTCESNVEPTECKGCGNDCCDEYQHHCCSYKQKKVAPKKVRPKKLKRYDASMLDGKPFYQGGHVRQTPMFNGVGKASKKFARKMGGEFMGTTWYECPECKSQNKHSDVESNTWRMCNNCYINYCLE